ncbi:MAG: glycosyltransferase [Deltaproteobacteria bacterium]
MHKKISIMHIRDSNGIYGAERVILTLGKNIAKERYNFILLCIRRKDGRSEELINRARRSGIHVIPVDVKGRIDFGAVAKMRKIIKNNGVSITHSHDYKSDLYALIASMNLGVKRVTTAHGSTRDSWRKRLYLFINECIVYRFIDRVVAVSADIANHLKNQHIKPECIKIIQNGIDVKLYEGESENRKADVSSDIPEPINGRKTFGVIGRLFPDKGHRYFIKAFANVLKTNPSITGMIFGDGPLREDILRQVEEMNLQNHIHLCGVRSDIKGLYESIDYLIIPSLREGLPYVLLEAMINEIPVVASAVGDIPLLVENQVTGYLVKPGDVEAIEKAMITLIKYPVETKKMTQRAYRIVSEKFTAERMVRENEEVYRSLLTGEILGGV